MTIIEPDIKSMLKAGGEHDCTKSWPKARTDKYNYGQTVLPGTLRQCPDCHKWYYAKANFSGSNFVTWRKVRWYHTHYNERIIKEGGHIG